MVEGSGTGAAGVARNPCVTGGVSGPLTGAHVSNVPTIWPESLIPWAKVKNKWPGTSI